MTLNVYPMNSSCCLVVMSKEESIGNCDIQLTSKGQTDTKSN